MHHHPLTEKIEKTHTAIKRVKHKKLAVEHITTQLKLYRQKEDKTAPYGALQAAVEDRFGMAALPPELVESNNLIAKIILKDLMKRGHDAAQMDSEHGASEIATIAARLHDDAELNFLEHELQTHLAELKRHHNTQATHCERVHKTKFPCKKTTTHRDRIEQEGANEAQAQGQGWLHNLLDHCHI